MDQESESARIVSGSSPALDSLAALEAEAATAERPAADTPMLPTNHFEDIKVQANGIQIIATTKAHLLDVKTAWAGDGSTQFLGTTDDETLQEIARTFVRHHTGTPDSSPSMRTGTTSSGNTMGPGRPLGSVRSFPPGDRKL